MLRFSDRRVSLTYFAGVDGSSSLTGVHRGVGL